MPHKIKMQNNTGKTLGAYILGLLRGHEGDARETLSVGPSAQ